MPVLHADLPQIGHVRDRAGETVRVLPLSTQLAVDEANQIALFSTRTAADFDQSAGRAQKCMVAP